MDESIPFRTTVQKSWSDSTANPNEHLFPQLPSSSSEVAIVLGLLVAQLAGAALPWPRTLALAALFGALQPLDLGRERQTERRARCFFCFLFFFGGGG